MKYLAGGPLLLLILAPPPPQAPNANVFIIPIAGELDAGHVALVNRAARRIQAEKPALVIFELDTPGGRIDYMLRIGEEMMKLAPVPTAAYVRPMATEGVTGGAWSAGAYLALSCKRLFMAPGTVIGAAAPVAATPEGAKPVEEKYVSAFREKFRARAEQNGYPANLAVAMVDEDLEVFEVLSDGRKLFLTEGEIERFRAQGQTVEAPSVPYVAKGKLLTMTDRQVADAGMGTIAENRRAIYEDHDLPSPVETEIGTTWSEDLVSFLTSPMVSFLLLIGGILGIWVELKTPGFGAAGVLGILSFALLLFGHHLAGLAEIPEILLLAAGLALVALELFVIPGTGFAAIAGAVCVLAALILSLQDFTLPDPKGAPWEVDIMLGSVGRVMFAFIGAAVGFLLLMRFLPRVPFLQRLVLQADVGGMAPAPAGAMSLVGRKGHAVTPLHPGGMIEIDGETHDVVAEGDYVAKGEPVEVLKVEGMRIVVGKMKR